MPTLIPFEKLMPTIKKKNVCLSVVLIKFYQLLSVNTLTKHFERVYEKFI